MNSVLPFSIAGAIFAYLTWVRMTGTTRKEEENQLREKFDGSRYVTAGMKMNPFHFNIIESDNRLYRIKKNALPFTGIAGETEVVFEFEKLTEKDERIEDHYLLEPYGVEEVEVNVGHNTIIIVYDVAESDEVVARVKEFQNLIEDIESSSKD